VLIAEAVAKVKTGDIDKAMPFLVNGLVPVLRRPVPLGIEHVVTFSVRMLLVIKVFVFI
jgi:hypothetical protein